MNIQELIATHNQKLAEFQNLIRMNQISPSSEEAQLRIEEINNLKRQITDMQNQSKQIKNQRSINVEQFIGKNVMAIVASLLIFISIVILCGAVIPYMNDLIKTGLIFGVSTLFMVVGIGLMCYKKNAWSITLTSCGLVSIYISAIASNVWLETLPDVGLYIITFMWAIIAVVLSKTYSSIFEVICIAGIMVSSFLDSANYEFYCHAASKISPTSTITLGLVGYTIFLVGNKYKNSWIVVPKDIFVTIFSIRIVSTLMDIIDYTARNEHTQELVISSIAFIFMLMLSTSYNYIRHIKYNIHKTDFMFTIISVIWILAIANQTMIVTTGKLEDTILCQIILIINTVLALTYVWFTVKAYKDNDAIDIIKSILSFLAIAVWIYISYGDIAITHMIGFVPLIITIELIGFRFKNIPLKIMGLILFLISNFVNYTDRYVNEHLGVAWQILLSIFVFAYIMQLIQKFKEQYSDWFKGVTLIIGLVGTVIIGFSSLEYLFDHTITLRTIQYLLVLAIVLSVLLTPLGVNPITNKESKPIHIMFRVLSELFIAVTSLTLLINYSTKGIRIEAIIMSIVIICFALINTENKIGIQYREFNALYNIFKLTMISWLIILVLLHISSAISAISILISVLGIVVGFKFRLEYIRIYGLILSIMSIIKISFVDINLEGSLGTAICMFICGVLCFCISFAYNRIDKVIGGNINDNINMYKEN